MARSLRSRGAGLSATASLPRLTAPGERGTDRGPSQSPEYYPATAQSPSQDRKLGIWPMLSELDWGEFYGSGTQSFSAAQTRQGKAGMREWVIPLRLKTGLLSSQPLAGT